jgi:hypothetical protein
MLFLHPAFHLSSYILPRDPQKMLRPNKPLTRTAPCEPVSDFISYHSGMARDPVQPHGMPGRDIIQFLLALLHQRKRCFGSLKCFQSHLTIRANTDAFLWPILSFSFMNTG